MIRIDEKRCTGCGACVEVCPAGAIRLVEGATRSHAKIDEARCRECEACVEVCPEQAIVSDARTIVEGKWVQLNAPPVLAEPRSREVRPARSATPAQAWVGAALAFAGREIVPRLAELLLDAWDRRTRRPPLSLNGPVSTRSAQGTVLDLAAGGGHRHRLRRRQGRR